MRHIRQTPAFPTTLGWFLPVCFFCLLAPRGTLSGQAPGVQPEPTPASWQRLGSLAAGSKVRLTLPDGSRVKGRFQVFDEHQLSVGLTRAKSETFKRSDIARVEARRAKGSSRNRELLGAGLGLAAGIGIAFAASESADVATRITIPVIGGLGSGLGALVGWWSGNTKRNWELVYHNTRASDGAGR